MSELDQWVAGLTAAENPARLREIGRAIGDGRLVAWLRALGDDGAAGWLIENRELIGAGPTNLVAARLRELRKAEKQRTKDLALAERLDPPPRPQGGQDGREYPDPHVLGLLQRTKPRSVDEAPKVRRNAWNLGTILREDPRLKGRWRYNELRSDQEMRTPDGGWRQVTDVDDVNLCRWVSDVYGLDYTTGLAREQVLSVAHECTVHPVRDYLRSLVWDGTDRLPHLLADYFGAEQTELHARIGTAWMVSLVARAEEPGCKVDTVPVFVGAQGTRKSSTIRAMVPDTSWYADSDIPLHHAQDQYQVLQGKWLFELAEFDRYCTKADAAKIKAYVTQQVDSYRESFGRRTVDRPRRVGFAATMNPAEVFVDPTGARRFWPILCGDCNPDGIAAIRDQLWAEAVVRYRRKEGWLLSAAESREIAEVADTLRQTDPWERPILEFLKGRASVIVDEVLKEAVGVDKGAQDKAAANRVTAILRYTGWTKDSKRGPPDGKGPYAWRPPSKAVGS
jgi:putative DNA primase/helicase